MSDATQRARLAAGILDNPLFNEACDLLRDAYLTAATRCGPTEDQARWRYIVAINDLKIFRDHLATVLQTGEIQAHNLAVMREQEKRDNIFKRVIRGFHSDDASTEKPLDAA